MNGDCSRKLDRFTKKKYFYALIKRSNFFEIILTTGGAMIAKQNRTKKSEKSEKSDKSDKSENRTLPTFEEFLEFILVSSMEGENKWHHGLRKKWVKDYGLYITKALLLRKRNNGGRG